MKKLIALSLAIPFLAGPPLPGHFAAAQPSPSPTCDRSSLQLSAPRPAGPPPAGQPPGSIPLKLAYHAIFPGGSRDCFIDYIHAPPQPVEEGDAQLPGQVSTFTAGSRGLILGLTPPFSFPDDATPSVGLFSTSLNYGPGAFFLVRATFVGPNGPLDGKAWAVGLNAREGDKNDVGSVARLNLTLRFKKNAASLNVYENGDPRGSIAVLTPAYDAIVSTSAPQPFTLELLVNRITGKGTATLITSGTPPQALPFTLKVYTATSGPVVQAIGPSLANCCVPNTRVSVEVIDFQIWALPRTTPHGERG